MDGTKVQNRTLNMVTTAMCAVFIAITAWIAIPTVVPFTLQTFGVFVVVGILGGKRGTLTILTYLLLGMIGIPVFTGFQGGIGVLLGATGGYIIGLLCAVLLMWGIERILGRKTGVLGISMVLGLMVCYALGTIWYMLVYARGVEDIGWVTTISVCVLPFVIPDMIKIILALLVSKSVKRIIKL